MSMSAHQKIDIELPCGFHLVAEQNCDLDYPYEIFLGITDENGVWLQNLAVVRNQYFYTDDDPGIAWSDHRAELMVYENEHKDDYTEYFEIEFAEDPKTYKG
jgi:hypothetical protein